MPNSKAKGKRGELMLVHKLKEYGFENARRSQQFAGINNDADVVGALDGIHIECKFCESLNLDKAMEQSIRDAREGEMPCVFHKKSRREWYVNMRLDDFVSLYKEAHK